MERGRVLTSILEYLEEHTDQEISLQNISKHVGKPAKDVSYYLNVQLKDLICLTKIGRGLWWYSKNIEAPNEYKKVSEIILEAFEGKDKVGLNTLVKRTGLSRKNVLTRLSQLRIKGDIDYELVNMPHIKLKGVKDGR